MSLQHFGKATLRVAKNYTKGYSDTQAKVRDATSNDPWGPTGQQMNEIAQMTYNQNDFVEIMEMLDKRLNDKGKNWRHVFKALTVLDYLLHNGSENVIIYFRDNLYIIKTLKEFQYVDEYSKDQGANVRQKAKDITNLLQDESRLREERRNRASMRDRMAGGTNGLSDFDDENETRRKQQPKRRNPEDDELRKAIEASKQSLADEQAKKAEEDDLARAIKLSEEEEKKRNQSVVDSNSRSLFDEQAQSYLCSAQSSNNPFPLVDPSAQFSQNQLQPQYTSMMPQFTSFNPYQQQAQQEAMQTQYMLQQQEWMRQQQEAQQAQLLQAQQQAQQEEWNRQQQMLLLQQQQQAQQQQYQQQQLAPQQPLFPQQTGFGSNNPFAPATQSPPPLPQMSNNASGIDSFSLPSTFANSPRPSTSPPAQSTSSISPAPSPASRPARNDGEHAHLANLLANREDGQDTFGNVGQLRYGHSQAGRLLVQKTGHNPFAAQQQQQQQTASDQPFFSV
ncbi:ENTH-domain-containing protein [Fomitiporia mediterranea MF3/22]|uniref:ENTH-domain-containing protein n=1 Tax=Fomitiporia mediterranea (strain MF3/22) TaxID=694068 RepID=UPI00044082EA|nr:ENTH-domain-containing protein [Fomitiporia mediterranea MF3/22]EJD00537.1 ENTH-domain-containing protein [Fomitiporia mediterranea MF3/22]